MSAKILFLPVCIIAALAIFIWITKPAYDESKMEKAELEKKESTLKTLEDNRAALQKASVEYDSLGNSKTALVYNLLPKDIKTDDFVAEISNKAKESGIALSKIKTSPEAKTTAVFNSDLEAMGVDAEGGASTVVVKGFKVEAESFGSYDGFKKFISSIEGMNRYINLEKVAIKKVEAEEGSAGHDIIESIINLKIYMLASDDKLQIAKQIFASDPIIGSLSSGSFNKEAQEQAENYVTSTFQFVPSMEGLGKENIFFW